jgi:hypothetical protein
MENINTNDRSCQHPEAARIPLTNGKGLHCGACGENVHDEHKKSEGQTENFSVSHSQAGRYQALQASKGKWTVWDKVECKTVKVDGIELFRRKYAVRIADEMNDTTVVSIPRVGGDKGRDIAKRQRHKFIKDAEAAATSVVEKYQHLVQLNEQHAILYRKFAVVAEEMRAEIKIVFYFFAHKKAYEKLFGTYGTQDEWTQAAFGMTARNVRNHITPPKELPLLPANTESEPPPARTDILSEIPEQDAEPKQDGGIEDADYTDIPPTPAANEKPTVLQLLADTKPSFAIGVSPADVVSNSVKENSRLILGYARSFGRMMTESEWQETVREVINGLQYELPDDEPEVQVMLNVVSKPSPEGDQVA